MIQMKLKVEQERSRGLKPVWVTAETWRSHVHVPARGTLLRLTKKPVVMRVAEVLTLTPEMVTIYLVPTYVTAWTEIDTPEGADDAVR